MYMLFLIADKNLFGRVALRCVSMTFFLLLSADQVALCSEMEASMSPAVEDAM